MVEINVWFIAFVDVSVCRRSCLRTFVVAIWAMCGSSSMVSLGIRRCNLGVYVHGLKKRNTYNSQEAPSIVSSAIHRSRSCIRQFRHFEHLGGPWCIHSWLKSVCFFSPQPLHLLITVCSQQHCHCHAILVL